MDRASATLASIVMRRSSICFSRLRTASCCWSEILTRAVSHEAALAFPGACPWNAERAAQERMTPLPCW